MGDPTSPTHTVSHQFNPPVSTVQERILITHTSGSQPVWYGDPEVQIYFVW